MESDTQFYELFATVPEFFFRLTKIQVKGKHRFQSVTIKRIERSMDGLLSPEDPQETHWLTEFQMQRKKKGDDVYHRLALEVAALYLQEPKKKYGGLLIFGSKNHDTKTEPWFSTWKKSDLFQTFYLDELLKQYEKETPNDPIHLVFKPFILEQEKLVKEAPIHYHQIKNSTQLNEKTRKKLASIFFNWFQIRFQTKTTEEIRKMLEITTPLQETVSYKEIYSIGKKDGELEGELKGKIEGKIEGEIKGKIDNLKDLFLRGLITQEIYQKEVTPLEIQFQELLEKSASEKLAEN